jgi:hypothetical protein
VGGVDTNICLGLVIVKGASVVGVNKDPLASGLILVISPQRNPHRTATTFGISFGPYLIVIRKFLCALRFASTVALIIGYADFTLIIFPHTPARDIEAVGSRPSVKCRLGCIMTWKCCCGGRVNVNERFRHSEAFLDASST